MGDCHMAYFKFLVFVLIIGVEIEPLQMTVM